MWKGREHWARTQHLAPSLVEVGRALQIAGEKGSREAFGVGAAEGRFSRGGMTSGASTDLATALEGR